MYAPSTVSIGTTGDGQALAFQSGACLMDMEMVQFHPTVFPKGQGLLITEATSQAAPRSSISKAHQRKSTKAVREEN